MAADVLKSGLNQLLCTLTYDQQSPEEKQQARASRTPPSMTILL